MRMAGRPNWRGVGFLRIVLLVIAAAAIAAVASIFGIARLWLSASIVPRRDAGRQLPRVG
jgi:hypothetical protein